MRKKYQFGDIVIIAYFTNNWTKPNWDNSDRPLYKITLRGKDNNNIRHTVSAWGNVADAPDEQHQSLAGLVLEEHLRDPENFTEFCSNYGYDEDSRKAFTIWQQLEKCFATGKWVKLAGEKNIKKWETSGDDLEKLLKRL